ncbi:hypothetical protein E3P92_02150 [Wallemia ichthyophaga]|uniref:sterol 22-desaturase n=2 Tax=Wallemia ichthyophaga TaxID=245174 RepID=A0A4T0KA52_WALIC|nr:Cytochrome 61 [Wallemia ichthyophaga EXF-994]TIA72272.1 hypothetical protein E3P91_02147 [Wallemia ichthyophaga]EOR00081.1 Cytochrome 61 [Wallemia ichthyophaga EXF-994]TIA81882.1 hypothetical protein E3P98_01727 [Wallemia ichthyophaga]TIA91010.1 hypothetical protein E3P97_02260 [Wallemia ichthyophaga]TIB00003.1 hypothetical protein E3P95_01884 [Wallemia ichthyophaga]
MNSTQSYYTDAQPVERTSQPLLTAILAVAASLLILEQAIYKYKKGHLPGPSWSIPIIGRFADSLNPSLENYMSGWKLGDLSAVSVFNIFIVQAAKNEYSRKIFSSASYAEPCLVASAKKVLDPNNWVFLNGKVHSDYRKGLNVLFTRRALSSYLPIQESIYRKYFDKWTRDATPKSYMMSMRDLNMETSLKVFCGEYIPQHAQDDISAKYWLITVALELVNFPFAWPGTKVYKAIKARKVAVKWFEHASAQSKERMSNDAEPECLLDHWTKAMHEAKNNAHTDGSSKVLRAREFSDNEMAMVVLSFLFASQDAMTSGVVYIFQLLADHPEVLGRVREEQYRVRGGDVDSPTTLDMIDQMTYTRACIKESLRIKPPVIMVPYLTKKPFPINADYTVPKGTMLIPSIYPSLHDPAVYGDPESFRPERWLPDANGNPSDAEKAAANYLVFGHGPHHCLGKEYAVLHMTALIGSASVLMDWEHIVTPQSHNVEVIATIFPKDGFVAKFNKRESIA